MKEKFINKHLFVLQRKSNKNLLMIFSLIVSAMLFMVVALYPMMTDIVKELPSEIGDMITMTSIASYFNTEALEMWIFIVCIYVAGLAINITTKEFKNGSYEMLYTLNISRQEIIRTKLLRLVVNTFYINLISFVVALISLLIFGANDFKVFNLITYAMFALLVTLQVGIVVFSLGLINKDKFNNYGGMAVVLIMFLFATISIMTKKVEWLAYFSPMSTMNGTIMMDGFKGVYKNGIVFGVWSVLSILLLVFSFKKFKNDDLC